MDSHVGNWVSNKSENQDAVMEAMGLPADKRAKIKEMSAGEHKLVIAKDGDGWAAKMVTPAHTHESKFQIGKEFTEKSPIGLTYTCKVTVKGDKVINEKTPKDGGKAHKITTYIKGAELIAELECNGVVGKRIFKKA